MYEDSKFSLSFPALWLSAVLASVNLGIHCSLCILLMTNDGEYFLMCPGHLYIFFGEMSIEIFCLFFNWLICLFIVEL